MVYLRGESSQDIKVAMKIEPFYFNHWMLSLVMWESMVDSLYPLAIIFLDPKSWNSLSTFGQMRSLETLVMH